MVEGWRRRETNVKWNRKMMIRRKGRLKKVRRNVSKKEMRRRRETEKEG